MRFSLPGMAFAATAAAWSAYALPAVRPVLPPVEHADTETVTNVPFTAWERGLRAFRFDLAFTGTASNNVEMAFGTDADGDGGLSDGEVDVRAGWDCGELFIAKSRSRTTARRSFPPSPSRNRRGSTRRAGTWFVSSDAAKTRARGRASPRRLPRSAFASS